MGILSLTKFLFLTETMIKIFVLYIINGKFLIKGKDTNLKHKAKYRYDYAFFRYKKDQVHMSKLLMK